jgi:predicted acylesterase/phospholipase RssA
MGVRSVAWTLLVAAGLGCGSARPHHPPEALTCGLQAFVVQDVYGELRRLRELKLSLAGEPAAFNVLALSAGGEFGAYGAAFLRGWGSVGAAARPGPRADIRVVTGVSTGAIMATHAFLGEDQALEQLYRGLSGSRIYQERSTLSLLWASSIFDAAGKERLIEDNLTHEVIDRVAQAPEGRALYVGVVDLDSGGFLRIDMVKLAREAPASVRDDCYRAVISASSAIPIAFPPRFVDKLMLVDGGARRHLFITEVPDGQAGEEGPRRLFSLVHGDLDVGCTTTKNGVLQIALRTSELMTDQSMKDSLRLQEALASAPTAQGPLFETYYASAAAAARACAPKQAECAGTGGLAGEDMFCQPFMNCLADQGYEDGRAYAGGSRPWLTFADLHLSSQADCSATSRRTRAQ